MALYPYLAAMEFNQISTQRQSQSQTTEAFPITSPSLIRLEKPFLKAGNKWFKMKALNRYYPHVRGRAMSAYDHPYGGKTGGKPTMVSHGTPPGRKAGHIGARRTGRRKGKSTV